MRLLIEKVYRFIKLKKIVWRAIGKTTNKFVCLLTSLLPVSLLFENDTRKGY